MAAGLCYGLRGGGAQLAFHMTAPAWLATQRSWLVVERLPAYAPELHPVEGLWSCLKAVELAGVRLVMAKVVINRVEGNGLSRVILFMAMSLDGFVTGPRDDAQNPAGINGMRLMDWLGDGSSGNEGDGDGGGAKWRPRDPNSQIVFDESLSTGAVITGKRTGDFAGYWGGDHHNNVPIFVPTHKPPAENPFERVHYVTDGIQVCVKRAKAAAGDRDVMLHGAYTAQECLKAGVLDVLEIQLRPVLLGQGRRLFDGLPSEHIELDLVRTLEAPATLHLRYEVRRL